MAEKLLERKIATLFTRLDIDGNGSLDQADLGRWADKLIAARNLDAEGESQLRARLDFLWTAFFAPADTDNSGSVDLAKMTVYIKGMVADETKRQDLKSLLPQIFDAIDSDKSGSLSKEKYVRFFKALNVDNEALANQVFESIDSNGDGSVSKEDFAEFGKNFFSCAENDPASLLFGPLVD